MFVSYPRRLARQVATRVALVLFLAMSACFAAALTIAAEPAAHDRAAYEQAVSRAVDFLANKGQAEDGSFTAQAGPAITALVTTALLAHGRTPEDPTVSRALAYIESFIQPDGGIYKSDSNYRNYETCLGVLCLSAANVDGKYDTALAAAEKYIRGLQWDEGEGVDASNVNYGGAGYGGSSRPDLSNTSFFLDALVATGSGADDEAIQRALVFVSRCQNLESEHNTTAFAAKDPDGGFYYTPAAGGASPANKGKKQEALRSYGTMTYAGLKSMIYAGVDANDPRVVAALEWLKKNYDLSSNPGMGSSGLFYYYHTFAKTLAAYGQPSFADASGAAHDWRAELVGELVAKQQADGSWKNTNAQWFEGDPNLVTGYALLALSYCQQE